MRIDLSQVLLRGFHFRPANRARIVQDLSLKIAQLDEVGIHDAETSHSGRCQVERGGRAEPTRTYDEHACGTQPALPLLPDPGED
jgi:hypothetical protein